MRVRLVFPALLLLPFAATGCGSKHQTAPLAFVDLSRGPTAILDSTQAHFGSAELQVSRRENGWQIQATLPPQDLIELWKGLYRIPRPFPVKIGGLTCSTGGEPLQILSMEARAMALLARTDPPSEVLRRLAKKEQGMLVSGPWLYLVHPTTQAPLVLEAVQEEPGTGRLILPGVAGDGFLLPPGGSVTRSFRLEAPGTLRFELRVWGAGIDDTLRVEVEDDDSSLLTLEIPLSSMPKPWLVAIPLAAGEHELHLRASPVAALIGVLAPRVTSGKSKDPRPDITLMLADTYRADNLATWGGDARIAPHLNALASASLCFTETRTAATWTLPSHAALFTGLYPTQVGVLQPGDRLPDEAQTLAEHLADLGYRTVAITDQGYVSQTTGMAQGFSLFEEGRVDPERTRDSLERVLNSADGRPTFLFLHSYRAHDPYHSTSATQERLGPDFDPGASLDEVIDGLVEVRSNIKRGVSVQGEAARAFKRYELHYRRAAADLDILFGECVELLPRDGVLCVTSDHGESFGEHGVGGHGSSVWRAQTLVPLMFRAPGLDPGQDSRPASLIDLPRTLCDLAGLVPDERWGGRSLLEKPRSGPRFSFQTRTVQEARDAALFSQEKVLIVDALAEDTLRYAYDRLEDPLETIDRASEAPFVELRRSLDSVLRNVRQSRMKRAHAEIGLEQKINLQALGYGGDQE